MFTVIGKIQGHDATVTYDNGKLTGILSAVQIVEILAANSDGRLIGPVNQYTEKDHLKTPLSALFLIQEVFTEITEITGDIPEPAEVPENGIV